MWKWIAGGAAAGTALILFVRSASRTEPASKGPFGGVSSPIEAAGRKTWAALHAAADNYNPGNAEAFNRFLVSSIQSLPCYVCRDHGMEYVRQHPLDGSSREAVVLYMCRFHNEVNARLGKPIVDCRLL